MDMMGKGGKKNLRFERKRRVGQMESGRCHPEEDNRKVELRTGMTGKGDGMQSIPYQPHGKIKDKKVNSKNEGIAGGDENIASASKLPTLLFRRGVGWQAGTSAGLNANGRREEPRVQQAAHPTQEWPMGDKPV